MKINADYTKKVINENGDVEITLLIKSYNDKKAVDEIEKGNYNFEIKKPRSKRSLNQNRLFWKLCRQVAEVSQEDYMDTYIKALEATKAVYVELEGIEEIEDALKKQFRAVRVVRPAETEGFYVYRCFIGSSQFNTEEMNKLIDVIISWCYALDIRVDESEIY